MRAFLCAGARALLGRGQANTVAFNDPMRTNSVAVGEQADLSAAFGPIAPGVECAPLSGCQAVRLRRCGGQVGDRAKCPDDGGGMVALIGEDGRPQVETLPVDHIGETVSNGLAGGEIAGIDVWATYAVHVWTRSCARHWRALKPEPHLFPHGAERGPQPG